MSLWKRDFASGLIVLLPILVTAYIVALLFARLSAIPFPLPDLGLGPTATSIVKVVLLLLIFVLLVFSLGYMMRTAFGDIVEDAIDDVMNQVPGLRVVYNASKLAVETAVSGTEELQTPVKIEPWKNLRMTAFKTGKTTVDGRDILFLPTAPNITTGFVLEADPADYEVSEESVEEALTRILSAGFGETEREPATVTLGEDDPGEEAVADGGGPGGSAGAET